MDVGAAVAAWTGSCRRWVACVVGAALLLTGWGPDTARATQPATGASQVPQVPREQSGPAQAVSRPPARRHVASGGDLAWGSPVRVDTGALCAETSGVRTVSCPEPAWCALVLGTGVFATSTDPLAADPRWTRHDTGLPADEEFYGASCPSVSPCVAWGSDTHLYVTDTPTAEPPGWQRVARETDTSPAVVYGVTGRPPASA